MTDELRPCPFCGSKAQGGTVIVTCTECLAEMMGATPDEAAAAWNRRVAPDSPPFDIATLRAELAVMRHERRLLSRAILDLPPGYVDATAHKLARSILADEPAPAGDERAELGEALIQEMLGALRFARSVIKSGEPWTYQCEYSIGNAISKATEHLRARKLEQERDDG